MPTPQNQARRVRMATTRAARQARKEAAPQPVTEGNRAGDGQGAVGGRPRSQPGLEARAGSVAPRLSSETPNGPPVPYTLVWQMHRDFSHISPRGNAT